MPMLIGASLLLLLFLAAAFPWLLALRARFGHLFAVPATAVGALVLCPALMALSPLHNTNRIRALVIASVLVGALGILTARRPPKVLRRPGRYGIALWCPALLGAVVWIA